MSIDNVKKFYDALSRDKAMQQKFIDLSRQYQDVAMDTAKIDSIIEQDVLPLAKQEGYDFTLEDIKSFGADAKQARTGEELNEEEMQAVTGGLFICVFFGAGDHEGGKWCVLLGTDSIGQECLLVGVTQY